MWAPAVAENNGRYYFFFAANDIQNDHQVGGLGVAVADNPDGPFKDYLGKPLIDKFHNGAQPIDPFVFRDNDGQYYLIYGGWRPLQHLPAERRFHRLRAVCRRHGRSRKSRPRLCRRLGDVPARRQILFHVVGRRLDRAELFRGLCDGGFADSARSSASEKFCNRDPTVATGAGHHSVIHIPGTDIYYIVYHRRPLGETDGNHRVTCIDQHGI